MMAVLSDSPLRVVGIVQARMTSNRLPGKVLRQLGGRSVLGRVVRAAQESGVLADLVVATSTDPSDDPVESECANLGVACFRGSLDDVLTRFIGALDAHPGDAVMRFTADCPLLDPELIATAAQVFQAVPGLDYLSTSIQRCVPRGLDVEIASAQALRTVDRLAESYHRSHVTSYLYTHPETLRVLGLVLTPDTSHLRLTLDTPHDWALISTVVGQLGEGTVPLRKLVDWLDANPGVRDLNAHVRQKPLDRG
jgi:spore coat polysaccharide biosynthesis protein SpsF